MGRKTELIIERRYAQPTDPDFQEMQEQCAAVLLEVCKQHHREKHAEQQECHEEAEKK